MERQLTSASTRGLDADDAESIEKKINAAKAAEKRILLDEREEDERGICLVFWGKKGKGECVEKRRRQFRKSRIGLPSSRAKRPLLCSLFSIAF